MEQVLKQLEVGNGFDSWSSELAKVEMSDDSKRAILVIPLMHYGPNKKGLFWTEEMLEDVAPMFRAVTFRYDLNGQEGSSHTVEKLSSPHFDVGWTYSGDDGAWYDEKTKTLWVKGEVTHPQVIEKLKRSTTDGKREVNYASMGVVVEKALCSICGEEYGTCEHERLQDYNGHLCYKVPTECSKGLHVALTNDPADGEADIKSCIFQELGKFGGKEMFNKSSNQNLDNSQGKNSDVSASKQNPQDSQQISPNTKQQTQGYNNSFHNNQSQIPGGLATSSPMNEQPGMAPSPELIMRDLAERIKTIEQKIAEKAMREGTPELVNSSPQDQMMQDGMGGTSQFGQEENKMDESVKVGQASNAKAPLNPPAKKAEVQDVMQPQAPVDPMQQVMQMLQQILAAVSSKAETQDVNELINVEKGKMKKAQDDIKTEHLSPGDAVGNVESEGNKKNKENMLEPGKVATADMMKEMADMREDMKKMKSRLELQDNNIPEFGGSAAKTDVEVADMSADERAKKFGDFGKFDAIFNGKKSASRFSK